MAIENRLFNRAMVRAKIKSWQKAETLSDKHDELLPSIAEWASVAAKYKISKKGTEEQFKGEFLDFLFTNVLNFKLEVGAKKVRGKRAYSIKKEHRAYDGKKPDAILGQFAGGPQFNRVRAVVEVKGFEVQNLEARGSRGVSPVAQAFEYQSKYQGCEWVVVTNMSEVRIYHVILGATSHFQFSVEDLMDFDTFLMVRYLMDLDHLVEKDGPFCCETYQLIDVDWGAEKEAIDMLYLRYEAAKRSLLAFYQNTGMDNPLRATQVLLNRFLFILISSSKGLIPSSLSNEIASIIEREAQPYPKLKRVFSKLDKGSKREGVEKYNGGLFKTNNPIDGFDVSKKALLPVLDLWDIDFNSENMSTEILGKVFQKSLANTKLSYIDEAVYDKSTSSIAEQTGAVYTSYFVAQAMAHAAFKALAHKSPDLKNIKVLDPCCGSGTFVFAILNQMRNFLVKEGFKVDRRRVQRLLNRNIKAIDINDSAVEVTKLSLYLDLADKVLPLPDCMEGRIMDTDTLKYPGREKFDIIIGNPPYVRNTSLRDEYKEFLEAAYEVNKRPDEFVGSFQYDIYMSFFEKAYRLLKDNGVLVFICSNKFLFKDYGITLRALLTDRLVVEDVYDVSQMNLFRGASVYPYIFVCRKKKASDSDSFSIYRNLTKIQDLVSVDQEHIHKRVVDLSHCRASSDKWLISSGEPRIMSKIKKRARTFGWKLNRGIQKTKLKAGSDADFVTSGSIIGSFIDYELTQSYAYKTASVRKTKSDLFGEKQIVLPRTVPRKIVAASTTDGDHIFDRVYFLRVNSIDEEVRPIILPYLNSCIATYAYADKYGEDQVQGGYWDLSGSSLSSILFPMKRHIKEEHVEEASLAFEQMNRADIVLANEKQAIRKKYNLRKALMPVFGFQHLPDLEFLEIKIGQKISKSDWKRLVGAQANYFYWLYSLDLSIGRMLGLSKKEVKLIHNDVLGKVVLPKMYEEMVAREEVDIAA